MDHGTEHQGLEGGDDTVAEPRRPGWRKTRPPTPRPWLTLGRSHVEPRGVWVPKGRPPPTQRLGFT